MEKLSVRRLVVPDPGTYSLGDLREARLTWAKFRGEFGFANTATTFGSVPEDNMKYMKDPSVLIYGLSLAPHRLSGINVCMGSTRDCRKFCVSHSGNGSFPMVLQGRIVKTRFLFQEPECAAILLDRFIENAVKKSEEQAKILGMRLNTFSDIPWEDAAPWIFDKHRGVKFFDYTKLYLRDPKIKNYSLTYSASELTTDEQILSMVESGKNVAVVFGTKKLEALPKTWLGFKVVDGDKSDARWKDPKGIIVGLRAKGNLRGKDSKFVRRVK